MNIGNKIFENRKRIGLSQEELGYKLNVTRQSVSLWENNQAQPSLENLIALSKIFNLSISELCDENDNSNTEPNKNIEDPIFKASTVYTEQLYTRLYKNFYFKNIAIICLGILIAFFIFIALLFFKDNNWLAFIPTLFIVYFALSLLKIFNNVKKLSQDAVKLHPNLKVEYSFYKDYFTIDSKSDNSNSTYNKKYSEIKTKTQDSEYVYLTFDGTYTVIDKTTCKNYNERLAQLIGLKQDDTAINDKTKLLLLSLFALSIASMFIGLTLVAISTNGSPLPEFPLTMAEHMWQFLIMVPIPLSSIILGCIYIKKGYKCKKNIVAGAIMTIVLCIFGSFPGAFANQISHDMSYLEPISAKINLQIPTDGYISIMYDYQQAGDSLAMVKINDKNGDFSSKLEQSNYWLNDTSFIPSNKVNLFLLTMTAKYDYFMVYSLTNNNYNNFNGSIIYFAYDLENDVLLIYCGNSF